MTKDTGGSAFPICPPVDASGQTPAGYPYPEHGMTLRDWFAGQALAGMMASGSTGLGYPRMADDAYEVADAMLAERSKP